MRLSPLQTGWDNARLQTARNMNRLFEFAGNHIFLFAALGGVILLLIANEIYGRLQGDKRIGPNEAVRLINHENAVVLDVRNAAEFKKGHILHARNVVAARVAEHESELAKFKQQVVLCYCALGTVAPQACEQLRKLGFERAYSLKGGLNAWQGANLPVTTK